MTSEQRVERLKERILIALPFMETCGDAQAIKALVEELAALASQRTPSREPEPALPLKSLAFLIRQHETGEADKDGRAWRNDAVVIMRAILSAALSKPERFDTPQGFLDWFAANYNGEVVFSDPAWHARTIFRTAVWHYRRIYSHPVGLSPEPSSSGPGSIKGDPAASSSAPSGTGSPSGLA